MGHIFISYSHKDSNYVEQLEKKLIEEGFSVWVDHRIDYGSQWPKTIERAVDTCDAYIVVMSEDSANSIWVQREAIQAEKRKKPFFPLLLKGEVWFSLGNIQYVDVTGGVLPPETFYENLEKVTQRRKGKTSFQSSGNVNSKTNTKLELSTKSYNPKILFGILGAAILLIASIFLIANFGEFLALSPPTTQTLDKDNDGILDVNDECPTRGDSGYGVDADGCPIISLDTNVSDSDNDGVGDSVDLCPNQGNLGYGIDATGCPKSPSVPDVSPCLGALDTRVKVGMTIEVTTNQNTPVPSLGIRPQPTLGAHKAFELLSGERMLVLDGPECSDNSYFWYITSSRGDGWVREGNTDYYYVDPIQ